MAEKIITEVAVADIFDNSDSFFINKNNSLMQILKQDIVFDVENGGTGAKTIEDAKINLNIIDLADEYDASKNYEIGEYCIYDNNLYKKTGSINDKIWNTDDWTITTVAHELNNLFVNDNEYAKLLEDKYDKYCILLANKYDESKSDNYKIGSYCIRDNVLYRKESVSFNDPDFSDNWKETTVANELSALSNQHELYGTIRTDNAGIASSGYIDTEKSWFTHRRDNHINIVTFHIYIAENIEINTETNLVVYLPMSVALSYGVAIRLSDNKTIPVKIDKDSQNLKIMSSNKTQLATNDEIVCTFTYLT